MTVMIIHRYFWPDTPPYASMLRTISGSLAESHEVSVFTAQPSYGSTKNHTRRPRCETIDGVSVRRARLIPESKANLPARLVNLVLFALQVFWHVRRQRPDVVMAATTPPILIAAAASLAAKTYGGRSIYHCQDLYPEVALATGALRDGLLAKALRWLDTTTMRRVDHIVVLSEDMRSTVSDRDPSLDIKVTVINNFAVEDFGTAPSADNEPLPAVLQRAPDRKRIVFAGNLGNFQGLDSVIDAALRTLDRQDESVSIEWLFLGEGQARSRLEQRAGEALGSTIRFAGHWPAHIAEQVVSEADLALVSLSPGVVFSAYPSKTLMYLSAGTPVAVVAETDSQLARDVTENALGFCVPPNAPNELASAVTAFLESADLDQTRRRCRDFAQANSSVDVQLRHWHELMTSATKPEAPQLVFILGAARSGTKFLRDTLAASEDVATIPYDINYVWRHGNESCPHDALEPGDVDERARTHIRQTIQRLAAEQTGVRPIIVEKTVSNTLRVDLLRSMYPDAKFVYLERDGFDVTESAHRQWTSPNDRAYLLNKLRYFPIREWRYALWFARNLLRREKSPIWGPRYPGIEEDVDNEPVAVVCARQWKASVDGWANRTPHPHLEFEVRYEELFGDSSSTLGQLCDFAGIKDKQPVQSRFLATAQPVHNAWPGRISPADQLRVSQILSPSMNRVS